MALLFLLSSFPSSFFLVLLPFSFSFLLIFSRLPRHFLSLYIYSNVSVRGLGSWKERKAFFIISALPTSTPQALKASLCSSRGTLTPFQCHVDVQRCPKPPVQGQLNVQRRPKLQFQCQLDVQRCPKRRSRANLTFKGA